MNLISSNNFFKNTITHLIRSSKSKLQEEEYSINDKESPLNFSNKTLLFQKKIYYKNIQEYFQQEILKCYQN